MVSTTDFHSQGFYDFFLPPEEKTEAVEAISCDETATSLLPHMDEEAFSNQLEQQLELAQQKRDWEAFLRLLNQSSTFSSFPNERWRQQAQIFVENVLLTADQEQLTTALGLMLFYKIKDTALWVEAMDHLRGHPCKGKLRQAWTLLVTATEKKLLDDNLHDKALGWLYGLEAVVGVTKLSPEMYTTVHRLDLLGLFMAMEDHQGLLQAYLYIIINSSFSVRLCPTILDWRIKLDDELRLCENKKLLCEADFALIANLLTILDEKSPLEASKLFRNMIQGCGKEVDIEIVMNIIAIFAVAVSKIHGEDKKFSIEALTILRQMALPIGQLPLEPDIKHTFFCVITGFSSLIDDYPDIVEYGGLMLESCKDREQFTGLHETVVSRIKQLLYFCLSSEYGKYRAFVLNWLTTSPKRIFMPEEMRVLIIGVIISTQLAEGLAKSDYSAIVKGIDFFDKHYKRGILRLGFMESTLMNRLFDGYMIAFFAHGNGKAFRAAVKRLFDQQLTLEFYRENKRLPREKASKEYADWMRYCVGPSEDSINFNDPKERLLIFLEDGNGGVKESQLPTRTAEERCLAYRALFAEKILSLKGSMKSETKAAFVEVSIDLVEDLVKSYPNKSTALSLLHKNVFTYTGHAPELLQRQLNMYKSCLNILRQQRSQPQYAEAAYITDLYLKKKVPHTSLTQGQQIFIVHNMITQLPMQQPSSYFFLFDLICSIHNELYHNLRTGRERACLLLMEKARQVELSEKADLDKVIAGVKTLMAPLSRDQQIFLVHSMINEQPSGLLPPSYLLLLDFIVAIHGNLYRNAWSRRIEGCQLLSDKLPDFAFVNIQYFERFLAIIKTLIAPTGTICEENRCFEEKQHAAALCRSFIASNTALVMYKLIMLKPVTRVAEAENTVDGPLADDRKLTEELNKAQQDSMPWLCSMADFIFFCFEKGGFRGQYLVYLSVIRQHFLPLLSDFIGPQQQLHEKVDNLLSYQPHTDTEKQLRLKMIDELKKAI